MHQIEKGTLTDGTILLSINNFSEKFGVARDTIEKSYRELKSRGFINATKGKGYYVIGAKERKVKVLFVFNKFSNFKKIIYYSFIKTLGEFASVDVEIHHGNPLLLNHIISKNIGKYQYEYRRYYL
jgi:DNA-binding transcriptional regulator YhcF (GntR family)